MGRRGHSTSIGKFAKVIHDQRVSEIRVLRDVLRGERGTNHAADVAGDAIASARSTQWR